MYEKNEESESITNNFNVKKNDVNVSKYNCEKWKLGESVKRFTCDDHSCVCRNGIYACKNHDQSRCYVQNACNPAHALTPRSNPLKDRTCEIRASSRSTRREIHEDSASIRVDSIMHHTTTIRILPFPL